MNKPPFTKIDFAPPKIEVERRDNGEIVLRSAHSLDPHPRSIGEMLHGWAEEAPERTFLAERGADGAWRRLGFSEVRDKVRALGQALLDRDVTPDRPVMILSDNGIDNALMQLAAMEIGVPVAPVSPAYSLMSKDHGKLKYIHELLTPGLIYAADGVQFETAFKALPLKDEHVVVGANLHQRRAELLDELLDTAPGEAVDRAFAEVGPDTVAKILFTSGSTGHPKGVKNTQRMLCSNQQAMAQIWKFLGRRPPVIVDWLPWSHTFGSNHNFNMILYHGGTFYIDHGKPAPGLIERTVENLKEISPTAYFNVPRGFDILIPYLEKDAELRESFFRDLDMIFYAAAALPQNLWDRLEKLAIDTRGERVTMLSAWGSTETAPAATSVHFPIERPGVIGLPIPGTEIKLAPSGAKMELRVRGPNVTPGYWRRSDATAESFDEDGFFKMGDAGKFADEEEPEKGLVFDGRTAENFKLMSGTWVHVGDLRMAVISACAPLIQDAVVTGHDREEIGLLIFPNPAGLRELVPDATSETPLGDLVAHPEVRKAFEAKLTAYNRVNTSNSRRIARAVILSDPPNIDANEITDKGYINQRAVLDNRAEVVEGMYADSAETLKL